jgi:uncharacterized protein (TIGR02118 family)
VTGYNRNHSRLTFDRALADASRHLTNEDGFFMVKYIICATRKAGLSREEFSAYWRNQHGPLVRSVPEFSRHVRKYVQCHLVEGVVPLGTAGSHDGVAGLWFDSVEDLIRAFNEPRYLEVIRPDEQKFVDAAKCTSFITEENPVI